MTRILAITNNGDTTYTVQFSAPLIAGVTGNEINMAFFSPGAGGWVTQVGTATPPVGDSIDITELNGDSDCTKFVMLDQPTTFSAALPFETAIPIDLVT